MNSFLELLNFFHLEYQEDSGEAEGNEGALYQREKAKEDKLHGYCQR